MICTHKPRRDTIGDQEQVQGLRVRITLSDRIRLARRLAGLSQSAASRLLYVHRGTFGHWERGAGHLPTSANLLRLANVFNVSFEWLATGRGAMSSGAACVADQRAPGVAGDEEHLLRVFRQLPAPCRRAVVCFAQSQAGEREASI